MRVIAGCCLFLCFSVSFAASPTVGLLLPRGAQRGTEVAVRFQGNNLADTQEVLVYFPGITVKKIDAVTPNEVKATLVIAPECRLGEHAFRLRTATGVSDLRTFWIGALPCIDEKEPNSDIRSPQPVPLNVTVQGLIQNEDVDYFQVECKKGQRLSVELEGMRLGTTFFDPAIAILDERNFELAVNDDSPIINQDCGASVVIPADGKYTIQVRECGNGGNGSSYYRLHVGNFPRPTSVVPAGGKPGETLELRFLGDPLGEIKQTVTLPTDFPAMARVHATNADGIHPGGIRVRVNDLTNVVETVNANTLKTPLMGTAPCAFHGILSAPGETDYFKFSAKKGQVLVAEVHARRLGSMLDPVLHVHRLNKEGQFAADLGANDDLNGPDSQHRFTIPEDGDYCLWIHDHLMQGGPSFFYRVELQPPVPTAGIRLPYVDGNNPTNQERQTWCVPKGGRLAVPVILRRADWGGAAKLVFDDLPPGVTATVDTLDYSNPIVPVVLEAKAEAAVGAKLAFPRIEAENGVVKASERGSVQSVMVTGGNAFQFHILPNERIAVAVVEAVPFSLEVVEPKVPLVLGGTMQVKVIAKRHAGFKGPITVLPVMTPPNLGINGSTVIPENATECFVSMNAAGNAAVKKWKLAFMAFANAGAGNLWVGSPLFNLDVAPAFVNFAQQRAAVEQGQSTQVVCKVTTATPFVGKAKATLVGLPPKVTAAPVEFASGQAEVIFNVTTDVGSPVGKHNTFCQVLIVKDGEAINHNVGGGELRIDPPPPKPAAAVAPPKPTQAPPKPLSRLEQLRKEQEEKEKAKP